MKRNSWIFILAATMLFSACKNSTDCEECQEENNSSSYPVEQPVNEVVEQVDSTINEMPEEIVMDETIEKNFVENKKKIEKKYGTQWDFCTCVRLNDSLDRVIKEGGEMNDNFMKRFDEVDSKCKAFLVMSPNQTPEERANHEKKILDCLKNQ